VYNQNLHWHVVPVMMLPTVATESEGKATLALALALLGWRHLSLCFLSTSLY
jgi:hypothetical protein